MANADLDIARKSHMRPITEIAAKLDIAVEEIEPYGHYKAKISTGGLERLLSTDREPGKLILVSAISPTPAGEGKTTTAIGLGDALNRIGKKAVMCLREPSLGPCFGLKGGAAGGGYSQVVPMEDINLHFTGDFHAIGLAHNLLSAIVDNHLHHGNELGLDPRRISWKRVVDMNDRALRNVVIGLGGPIHSVPRESSYDITVASEVMAIFCLVESLAELRESLGKIIVGATYDQQPVTAADLQAHGAMTALLKDAIRPNLVQTLENNPAFIHGGPFANIAHGCNSVIATKLARNVAEYCVTEAGFGADLGAEKFLDIKCRRAGMAPDAIVIVATVRALKYHGGVAVSELLEPDPGAVKRGLVNLEKHIENIHRFQVPTIVAINRFTADTKDEVQAIQNKCESLGVKLVDCDHWARGGAGAEALAEAIVKIVDEEEGVSNFQFLYEDDLPLWDKVRKIAQEIYGADDIVADNNLRAKFLALQDGGYGNLPVCIAKTPASLSADPALRGRPSGFHVPLQDLRLCAGAGFVVVLTGNILTMPGLPRKPAALSIDVNEQGEIEGLF